MNGKNDHFSNSKFFLFQKYKPRQPTGIPNVIPGNIPMERIDNAVKEITPNYCLPSIKKSNAKIENIKIAPYFLPKEKTEEFTIP